MKITSISIVLLHCLIVLSGCNRDEVINPPPIVNISEGAYILSEGNFTPGTSRLSFYNITKDSFYASIFGPGSLGITPDGIIMDNNNLYITEQGNTGSMGKIYKTDTTGRVITTNDIGINPYSLTVSNNKIYITNGPANNVSVVNKNDLNLIHKINTGVYPQEILAINNKVFVCNTGVFGGPMDSTVSVIDALTDQITATIIVRRIPTSLAVTNDNKLLIGCSGSPLTGIIYKFDPDTYVKLDSFNTPDGFDKDIAVNKTVNELYYISFNNKILKLNLSSKQNSLFINNLTPVSNFYYGYNYDWKNKKHYVADAKNFTTNGSLNVYDENGTLRNVFPAGIAPRRILIKLN